MLDTIRFAELKKSIVDILGSIVVGPNRFHPTVSLVFNHCFEINKLPKDLVFRFQEVKKNVP